MVGPKRNKRQGFDGLAIDVLLLIYGGTHGATRIAVSCCTVYGRFKGVRDALVLLGYVFINDGGLYLTDKGIQFVSFILKYWELFMNDSHIAYP